MTLQERLDLLLPDALDASRDNTAPRLTRYAPWSDIPASEPIAVRCAMAEREIMRRAQLGMAPGELIAGRLDHRVPTPPDTANPLPPDMFGGAQRAHTALDAEPLLRQGLRGMVRDIEDREAAAPDDEARVFYRSALISLEGLGELAERLRTLATELAATDPALAGVAAVLERVPADPARTFREALQVVHLVYFAGTLTTQALYGPGRIDRVLWPYYAADLEAGRITRDDALELICCQFLLMNHLWNLPQPVMVGGSDAGGRDITNELTRICLEADERVGLVNPSLGLAVNPDTPADVIEAAGRRLLGGSTKPSLFNDRVIVPGLERLGVPAADGVQYIHSTCVEITVSGCSNVLVASPYINLLRPLEWMLNGGRALVGDKHAPSASPPLTEYPDFDAFLQEYRRLLGLRIERGASEMREQRRARYEGWAFPLASCFTADCIALGRDMDRGGARYTWVETSNVGLANITDSLLVIKRRVFEDRTHTLAQVRDMVAADFPDETGRLALQRGCPRYGNDEPEADAMAGAIVETIYAEHYRHRDYLGGWFVPGFFCWVMHRILGAETGASPDGRRAGEVLADAAGAAQGRDRSGPTAAVRSITSWDHHPGLGGIVLNLRFTREGAPDAARAARFSDLLRTYFDLGGFEMQVNAVDAAVLREAQRDPDRYADLLVRIAGYSDYFTRLDPVMQEEVISRTEHAL